MRIFENLGQYLHTRRKQTKIMLFISIKHQQPDVEKIYSQAKDPFKTDVSIAYQRKRRNRDITIKNKYNTFIDYSHTTDDVYEILEVYNPTKKKKVLIAFDDMIGDMEGNKKISSIVIELLMWGRKFNISLVLYVKILFQSA